jgi:hypothetical protein
VLALSLPPAEWRALYTALEQHTAEGLRPCSVLDQLVARARCRPEAWALVSERIDLRLHDATAPLVGRSFLDLATLWLRERETMSCQQKAAMLWEVVRRESGVYGKLEAHLVGDVEVDAMRAFAGSAMLARCESTATAHGESSTD